MTRICRATFGPITVVAQQRFNLIKVGASKCDFWRYHVMYKHGGVMMDTDSWCAKPLDHWIAPNDTHILGFIEAPSNHRPIKNLLVQWGIISVPGHCFMKRAVDEVVRLVVPRREANHI